MRRARARFYRLNLKVKSTGVKLAFFQIGSDGGLLNRPVSLTQLVLEGEVRTATLAAGAPG